MAKLSMDPANLQSLKANYISFWDYLPFLEPLVMLFLELLVGSFFRYLSEAIWATNYILRVF